MNIYLYFIFESGQNGYITVLGEKETAWATGVTQLRQRSSKMAKKGYRSAEKGVSDGPKRVSDSQKSSLDPKGYPMAKYVCFSP